MTATPELRGQFRFIPMDRVIFGRGTLGQLGDEVRRLGAKRAFVTTGNSLASTDVIPRVKDALGNTFAGAYAGIGAHAPMTAVIEAAYQAAKVGADLLVSVGGSAVNNGTRVVATMLAEGISDKESLLAYSEEARHRGGLPLEGKHVAPHIGVPTTLSAGEFGPGGGVLDEERRRKSYFFHTQLVLKVLILDPEVTVHTPDWLWLSTGVKALDHALERIYCQGWQPATDATCAKAIELLFQYLPHTMRHPGDLEARGHCQVAAWLSMAGSPNASMGLSHSIGHALGTMFGVPHGYTSCVLQPYVMEFNRPASAGRQVLIARAAGVDTRGMSDEKAAVEAVRAVSQFIRGLGVPTRLRDVAVPQEALPSIAEEVFHNARTTGNPRKVTSPQDIVEVLEKAW